MRIAVTTPTGNIGRVVAQKLHAKGGDLNLVVRSAGKVQHLADVGAKVFEGSLEDPALLARAVEGVQALFWLTPPNYAAQDFRAFQNEVADAVESVALANPELKIVNLSSIGAHLRVGAGPISGLYDVEEKLNRATANVVHLRPTYFMENVFNSLQTIHQHDSIFSTMPADIAFEQIATRDIGSIAADILLDDAPADRDVIHIFGPETISFEGVASAVGELIGKSVRHLVIPPEQAKQGIMTMGVSENMADLLIEMESAMSAGKIVAPEGSYIWEGSTTFKDFLTETFLPAYQQISES